MKLNKMYVLYFSPTGGTEKIARLAAGELAARLGGDFITSRLVPLSTGIDMVGASVELAVGRKPDLTPKWRRGAAIHFLHAAEGQEGTISGISAPENLNGSDGVEEISLYKKKGDSVQGTHSSNDRLGHVITTGETPQEAMELGRRALAQICVEVSAY